MKPVLVNMLVISAVFMAPAQAEISLNPATVSDEAILAAVNNAANQNNITDITVFLTQIFQADKARFYSLLNDFAVTAPNAMQNVVASICATSVTPPSTSCTQLTALMAAALHNNQQGLTLTEAQKQAAIDAIENIEPAAGPEDFQRLNLNLDDNQFSAN